MILWCPMPAETGIYLHLKRLIDYAVILCQNAIMLTTSLNLCAKVVPSVLIFESMQCSEPVFSKLASSDA